MAYDFNTGLQYGSPAFDPTFIDDGNNMLKWKFNNQSFGVGEDHHDQSTIVVGHDLNGEPALSNTKWIKAKDQFQNPGDNFLFSFCFCVDDTKLNSIPLRQQFQIQELHVKSSHLLNRVLLGSAILHGAGG